MTEIEKAQFTCLTALMSLLHSKGTIDARDYVLRIAAATAGDAENSSDSLLAAMEWHIQCVAVAGGLAQTDTTDEIH